MHINEKLLSDTFLIFEDSNIQIRLLNEDIPWFVLIPKIENAIELTDLPFDNQVDILKTINRLTVKIKENFNFDKLNIATLGNIVNQLHIHIIARKKSDRLWPGSPLGQNKKSNNISEHIKFWKEIFLEYSNE